MLSVLLVYDYGLSLSDLAEEQILLIHESIIDARIDAGRSPPTEFQPQRDWYQDVLRESLKLAARTRLVLPMKSKTTSEQQGVSNPSITPPYSQGPTASGVQETGYNLPLMAEPNDIAPVFQMTDLDQWDFQPNMTDSTGQLFVSQGNFDFTQDNDFPFEASGSEMLGDTQDQSYWLRQQGKR
jgi:hypothetical protein